MTVLRDIVLLISRILLGVILAAHGIQKWTDFGVGAVADQFAGLGVPAPDISAPVVATAEILGGVPVRAPHAPGRHPPDRQMNAQ
ncbi:DoxX family protein [Corynebacterium bovis]